MALNYFLNKCVLNVESVQQKKKKEKKRIKQKYQCKYSVYCYVSTFGENISENCSGLFCDSLDNPLYAEVLVNFCKSRMNIIFKIITESWQKFETRLPVFCEKEDILQAIKR